MADPACRVELTASFLERLESIEAFLREADAPLAYDALLARGLPVGQVAEASGYASASAFCAMFKAAMGQLPRAFYKHNRF